jgi:hypothetical protein
VRFVVGGTLTALLTVSEACRASRQAGLRSSLESLTNRFVRHVSQISGGKICFVIPGVEGRFGCTNGPGERQVHIGGIG